MRYVDRFKAIRPFVNLKIPHNKISLTSSEKSQITRYYNKLEYMGYFNREQEGYILKDISRSKVKISKAPKITHKYVNVGTVVKDGKITTDTAAKISIRNGKVYVHKKGLGRVWRFEYNIAKDWEPEDFKKHILKQMGQKRLRKEQIFAIGAGIYEMRGTYNARLDKLAEKILTIVNQYKAKNEEHYLDGKDDQIKYYSEFMREIVVYENIEVLKAFANKEKKRKKRMSKRDRIRMK